jgi:hypothetical protein
LSQRDAYAIFVKDFADQPDLVRDTKPTDLPVSFRINVKAGVSAESTAQRYGRLSGVASVIVTGASRLFAGTSLVDPAQRPTSACTKP